ncbi:hypothetical protein LPJ53_004780 [Coemansia erecta]|uniref:Mss4-like protein n=1 Tax=Coemansia erecta TaxID=147472 RepID=A0A9W7XTQ0_9FUNG|nr:hypothetical protein LPJ53_004780 [Coemansia erecta]
MSPVPIRNPLTIKCPKTGCKSKVIRAQAATLVQRKPRTELPAIGAAEPLPSELPDEIAALLPANTSSADGGWFWMLNDMMEFENIGFSHLVDGQKYLSCADCDLAPLGYHDTTVAGAQDKEYLIAIDRVAYLK